MHTRAHPSLWQSLLRFSSQSRQTSLPFSRDSIQPIHGFIKLHPPKFPPGTERCRRESSDYRIFSPRTGWDKKIELGAGVGCGQGSRHDKPQVRRGKRGAGDGHGRQRDRLFRRGG
ncbi:hypothetical protein LINGRAPRIM_LOCUS2524 [Linum grandiflorum]